MILLLASTTVVLAHGHDDHAGETANTAHVPIPMSTASMNSSSTSPQSYFTYPASRGLILGHVILMILAWFFVLPISEPSLPYDYNLCSINECVLGVVLSIARSPLALPAQLSFLGVHTIAVLVGTAYSSKTPDLYENNAHNKVGWIITWIVVTQSIIGLLKLAVNFHTPQDADAEDQNPYLPMSAQALAQHHQALYPSDEYRYSRDSGHYTASEASRSQSISSMQEQEIEEHQKFLEYRDQHADIGADKMEKQGLLANTRTQRVATCIAAMLSQRTRRALNIAYNAIDYASLPLGFTTIVSGAVVYGGIFVRRTLYHYLWDCVS